MQNIEKEILGLSRQGYCCSQVMVKLGLDAMQSENPELLNAVSGLCGGMGAGLTCGILSGGVCLLALFDKGAARLDMIPRLVEWFQTTYVPCYGGISCVEILGNNPMSKIERCPNMMVQTFEKCRELLEEHGFEV